MRNGCIRDRYRLGHWSVHSIVADLGVGLMYSQATVRKVHDTLAPVPHAFMREHRSVVN